MLTTLSVRLIALAVVAAHTGRDRLHARRRPDDGDVIQTVILAVGMMLLAAAVVAALTGFVNSRLSQIR